MWPSRRTVVERIDRHLIHFADNVRPLPGIADAAARKTLTMQMVASLRRLDYTREVMARGVSPLRTDPTSDLFDPERAAMLHAKAGNLDEAFWLVFLSIHFGKHPAHGWRRVQDVYSGLGEGLWTWQRVSAAPNAFRDWLRRNEGRIGGAFGNHRKYESIKADSPNGTAVVVESYIAWVSNAGSHQNLVANLVRRAGNDPHRIFQEFYDAMGVARFGRLGKFDFLALVGRLGLAPIEPGIAYLQGATGPLRGARLLFGGACDAELDISTLEQWLCDLDANLQIGMQAMEDSLCNWQKSPSVFVHFKG